VALVKSEPEITYKDFKVLGTVPLQSHWHFLFLLLPPLPEFIATLSVLGLSFGCGSILLAFHFAESSFTLNILVVVFAPHIQVPQRPLSLWAFGPLGLWAFNLSSTGLREGTGGSSKSEEDEGTGVSRFS